MNRGRFQRGLIDPIDYWVSLVQHLPKNNVVLAKNEVIKVGNYMALRNYPLLDSGADVMLPDAYDNDGNLTVNSWELFKQEELARELDD